MENKKYTILIAEDDHDILTLLRLYLEDAGFRVIAGEDGEMAWSLFETQDVDVAILDIMMPKMNGYELIQKIRSINKIPILVLSAKNEDTDKIYGLELGADDYMAKPFNPLEVVARVNALLRRYYDFNSREKEEVNVITIGDLQLDLMAMNLTKKGEHVDLTPTEYKILSILMQTPGKVFTKKQICEAVLGEYLDSDENSMMVHVSNLREKIEVDKGKPKYLITVRGLGYKMERPEKFHEEN